MKGLKEQVVFLQCYQERSDKTYQQTACKARRRIKDKAEILTLLYLMETRAVQLRDKIKQVPKAAHREIGPEVETTVKERRQGTGGSEKLPTRRMMKSSRSKLRMSERKSIILSNVNETISVLKCKMKTGREPCKSATRSCKGKDRHTV